MGLPDPVSFERVRNGAFAAAVEGGADAIEVKIPIGHKVGIADAYFKRNPRMVLKACRAVEKHYYG